MNSLETLKAARALISTPQKWTQHCMAFSYHPSIGPKVVDPRNSEAICWCAAGAIMAQPGDSEDLRHLIPLLNAGIPKDFPEQHCSMTRVIQYNDSKTHSEVLAMFDATIASLEDDKCS